MERNDIYTPGITDHKIMHMLAVARKCYTLAREKYELSETTARKCFVMGLLHDIGYEFADSAATHPEVGAEMLNSLNVSQICAIVDAVRNHGKIHEIENVTKWGFFLSEEFKQNLNQILYRGTIRYGQKAKLSKLKH